MTVMTGQHRGRKRAFVAAIPDHNLQGRYARGEIEADFEAADPDHLSRALSRARVACVYNQLCKRETISHDQREAADQSPV